MVDLHHGALNCFLKTVLESSCCTVRDLHCYSLTFCLDDDCFPLTKVPDQHPDYPQDDEDEDNRGYYAGPSTFPGCCERNQNPRTNTVKHYTVNEL